MSIEVKTFNDFLIKKINKLSEQKLDRAIKDKHYDFLSDPVDKNLLSILIDNEKKKHSKQQICWITISKSAAASVIEFVNNVSKLSSYRLTSEEWVFAFESTSFVMQPAGRFYGNIHCHYLCLKQIGINKAQYLKRLEKILGDGVFNINIQIYTSEYYDDKLNYLKGLKDADQGDKEDITKLFRETYKLKPLYGGRIASV